MFVENFKRKQEVHLPCYFASKLDFDCTIKQAFWVYGIARLNYSLHGNVISFDRTHGTSRYEMVYAPFTRLDKHRLSFTFNATFLRDEKVELLRWLFDNILDATKGHLPICLITYQDPAMKEEKFQSTTHRFCIWHIMRKLF